MAISAHRRRIIRLAVRFQNAVAVAEEAAATALEYDSAFDAGEFSGPASRRALARQCDRLAERFGFASAEVAETVAAALGADLRMPAAYYGMPMPLPRTAAEHAALIASHAAADPHCTCNDCLALCEPEEAR